MGGKIDFKIVAGAVETCTMLSKLGGLWEMKHALHDFQTRGPLGNEACSP